MEENRLQVKVFDHSIAAHQGKFIREAKGLTEVSVERLKSHFLVGRSFVLQVHDSVKKRFYLFSADFA